MGVSQGFLQLAQTFRTSRWASTRLTEAVTRKGSTPMLSKRVMVEGASFVCRVDSTMWPVRAALTAISAVSKSRISPIMIVSGSCRRKERRAAAKVSPMLSLTCTWLIPGRLNSTGSSAVLMLSLGWLSSCRPEYRVVVLPEPVGPVTSTMP